MSVSFAVQNFTPFSAAGGSSNSVEHVDSGLLLFSGVILKVVSSCDTR